MGTTKQTGLVAAPMLCEAVVATALGAVCTRIPLTIGSTPNKANNPTMKTNRQDQQAVTPLASFSQHIGLLLAVCTLCFLGAAPAWATNGTWTNSIADGNWGAAINWASGTIADGADGTATFSSSATRTITLDTARTIGNLTFNTSSYNLIGGNTLTLQTSTGIPTFTVNAGTTTIGVPLSASQQVLFNGGIVALTNTANNLSGGLIFQENPFGFLGQGALGSGTIQVGNAPGGNNSGSGQLGFDALSPAAAGTAPVTLANNFVIRTIRWIIGQQSIAGLNPQPIIINGDVTLDMGNTNVRDIYDFQPLTINGALHGGQSGPSVFGLNLVSGTVTLTNPNNDFTGNINYTGGATLGVNNIGALGNFGNRINLNTANATLRIDGSFTIPNYQGANGIGVNVGANAIINCTNGNNLEIDAIVQGSSTLTKTGSGTLNLTAANTFSGPITLSAGTLQISGSGSVSTSAGLTVTTNSIFLLTDSASVANMTSVTVNNGGQFVMQGSPTINSLLAVTVNSGGLVDVSGLASTFTLGSGGSFSGGGSVNGSVIASSGSVIIPGAIGTVGTLSFNNDLTLHGQNINFDLRNNLTEGSGTNDEIVVGGNLNLNGGEKIFLNYLDGQLAAGTYTLIRYAAGFSGTFSLGAAYPNVALDQTSTPGVILLVVSGSAVANNLTWKGDGSVNVWDINTTANWITNWANPAIVYTDPSKVTFDDNGSNSPAISLNTTVLPNTVTFANSAKAYTVSGSGKISGSVGLTLKGTNSVTLTLDNDFTGGTTFTTNGILQLGNGGTAGSVGAGTITLGSAGPKVIVNRTTPITLPTVTGTGGTPQVVQNGSSTTTLGGSTDNAYLGAVVNKGTLMLGKASSGSAHSLGGATTVNTGGTLQLGGSGGDQIYSGVTVTMAGGTYDMGGLAEGFTALSGYGTVTDSIGGGNQTLTASPGLIVQNGTLNMQAGTLTIPTSPGFNVIGTMNMNGGTVNCTGGTTANLHGVAGGGTLNVNGGTMTGSGNYYFAVGNTYASSGVAVANFNGGTFTSTGELLIGFQKAARVTVNSGATLNLNFFSYGDTSGSSTNYLNGGLLQALAFNTRGVGTAVNYFNGVTAQAKANRDPWINTMTHAYISTNGFAIDANGYNISIVQGLEHDPALGATLDGGLTKIGNGTLTLKGANTFTGGITNQAGSLQFTTQGGKTSSTLVFDNATNTIQVAARGTTVTNQSLTLGISGTGTQGLNFNLGTLGLPTAPPLNVASTLTSAGNVAVGIIAPIVPPGQVALVKYGSFNPSLFVNWSVAPVPYVGLSLSNNTANKSIDLVVAPGNFPTWTAAANHTWDTTSIDWKMSLSSVPTNYFESTPPGPPVNFDDTATGANGHDVQINAQNVSPAFITMSNNQDYTFEGSYGIAGSGAIIKNGSGALILNNSGVNSYSGATLVTGGSVVGGAANALSAASDTTLTGSSLNIGANAQNIGNITLNESPLIGTGTLTGNGGALNLNSSNNAVLTTPLAGTIALGKGGTGMLSITLSNGYSGPTLVNAGTLRITDGAALGQGGFSAATWTVISPGGAVMIDGSLEGGYISTSEHMHLSGTGPTGMGCLIITNGDTLMGNGGAHTALDADATIYVAANSSLTNLAQYYGGNRITKSGPGLLYAAGVLLNNLTVSQGAFLGAGQIGNGNILVDVSVIVNSGATFGGIGPVTPVANLQAGSTLTPGLLGPGTLTFNNIVTNAANCLMEISKTGIALTNDQIVANSSFVFTGTITVTNLGPDALAAGDSFKLFTLTNYAALAGVVPSLPTLPAPLFWTNNLAVDGTIAVSSAVSTTPFAIGHSVTGTNLTLQWPSDHIGWRLLFQTNHLAQGVSTNMADWDVYPGAASVDQITIPVDPAKPTEFYRMVYP
jgi:autotransporter-associated beta strand protein